MLVLSRKVDQQIKIGHDITITVVRCDGGMVRLGIEAPDMTIHRKEVYDQIYGSQAPAGVIPVAEAVTDSPD